MGTHDIEQQMRQLLSSVALSTAPLEAAQSTPLNELGIDSVAMINLVYELEQQFDITIKDEDVTSENFHSIESLLNLVRLKCAV